MKIHVLCHTSDTTLSATSNYPRIGRIGREYTDATSHYRIQDALTEAVSSPTFHGAVTDGSIQNGILVVYYCLVEIREGLFAKLLSRINSCPGSTGRIVAQNLEEAFTAPPPAILEYPHSQTAFEDGISVMRESMLTIICCQLLALTPARRASRSTNPHLKLTTLN